MAINWKEILEKAFKKILIGSIAVLGVKAVENVVDGKDILGRETKNNFEKRPGKRPAKIKLDESDYKVT